MSYQHDLFVSYRRQKDWTPWVRDHLKELIKTYLHQELGKAAKVYVDENIETGTDWVNQLGRALATSKVILCVFSKDYFTSQWCLHELDLIIERSAALPTKENRLIIPTVVHDGDLIPDIACRIQPYNLKKFRNPHICQGTTLYQDFSEAVGILSPQIASAIDAAPEFNPEWVDHHIDRFNKVYEASIEDQIYPTSTFELDARPPNNKPPRLDGV